MQSVTIAGRVGRDAETRPTNSGSVTSFTVAVDQRNGRDKTTNWWRVSLWGQRGEKLAQYIRKGDNITVTGEFSLGEYEGKAQLNVNANDVALQGGKSEREENPFVNAAAAQVQRQSDNAAAFDDLDDQVPF